MRLEDNGITLRLFRDERSGRRQVHAAAAHRYGMGWIASDEDGQWFDRAGRLPSHWRPRPECLDQPPS